MSGIAERGIRTWDATNRKWVKWDGDVDVVQGGMSGATSDGSVTLAPVDTWVQVPDVIPASDYHMVVTKETETGQIRWSADNGGVPSATNGNKMTNSNVIIYLAGGKPIYFGSTAGTDVVNYTTIID